ncbi:hypothetical protein FF1_002535 [Malus domestica]
MKALSLGTELVVTHELAQYAVRADDFKYGIEEEPSWLSPLVLFMVGSMLFQDLSGFMHQHLAPSVGNDTKNHVGSLSFFHLTTVNLQKPKNQTPTESTQTMALTLSCKLSPRLSQDLELIRRH